MKRTMKKMTNSTIKDIKKFNNKLESYEERRSHVESVFAAAPGVTQYIENTMIGNPSPLEQQAIPRTIEEHGTYLLNSKDVTSGREQEYSYYRDERDFRSNYAAGNRTVSTDIEEREDLHEQVDFLATSIIPIEYLNRLFDFDSMTSSEWMKMLKFGLKDKDNPESMLKEFMSYMYELIQESIEDPEDLLIVDLLIAGKSQEQIGVELDKSRATIGYRINNVIRKKVTA